MSVAFNGYVKEKEGIDCWLCSHRCTSSTDLENHLYNDHKIGKSSGF
jgi:hypothetical protein